MLLPLCIKFHVEYLHSLPVVLAGNKHKEEQPYVQHLITPEQSSSALQCLSHFSDSKCCGISGHSAIRSTFTPIILASKILALGFFFWGGWIPSLDLYFPECAAKTVFFFCAKLKTLLMRRRKPASRSKITRGRSFKSLPHSTRIDIASTTTWATEEF